MCAGETETEGEDSVSAYSHHADVLGEGLNATFRAAAKSAHSAYPPLVIVAANLVTVFDGMARTAAIPALPATRHRPRGLRHAVERVSYIHAPGRR